MHQRDINRTARDRPIARHLAVLALLLGLWGALVLLFAAPLALADRVPWPQAVHFGASFWSLWLLFLPLVAWLSFRFPIERRRFLPHLGLHLLACLLLVGVSRAAFRRVADAFPRLQNPLRSAQSREARSDHLFPGHLPALNPFRGFPGFRTVLDLLSYWSLLGVCQGIRNFRISQERERRAAALQASLTTARLQALRMQINPHFLFNTLNSIAALVYVNPRAADEMLGDLSELLRRSLDSMEQQEISLAQELEFIAAYLNIEQKRFGDRLRFEQSVPGELMRALVPALILQPLIENAIRHGIEPQRAPGLISIEANRDATHLHLIVRDNGLGLPAQTGRTAASAVPFGASPNEKNVPPTTPPAAGEVIPSTSDKFSGDRPRGIGLANTQARLQELYGSNQTFSLRKTEPQGCQVHLQLPLHFEPMRVSTGPNGEGTRPPADATS